MLSRCGRRHPPPLLQRFYRSQKIYLSISSLLGIFFFFFYTKTSLLGLVLQPDRTKKITVQHSLWGHFYVHQLCKCCFKTCVLMIYWWQYSKFSPEAPEKELFPHFHHVVPPTAPWWLILDTNLFFILPPTSTSKLLKRYLCAIYFHWSSAVWLLVSWNYCIQCALITDLK